MADARRSQSATRDVGGAEDELVTRLYHRYQQAVYYTQLQESVLVSVNPYGAAADVNGDDVLREYKRAYRDTRQSVSGRTLPPHLFGLACNAYFYMQRTGQDQSLLFAGETFSGKSEARRLAVRAIVGLSVALPGKRGARLAAQLPAAMYALECLGSAPSAENPVASCATLYTELQFGENGRLLGFKMLEYFLERSRVSEQREPGPTLRVFYLMMAGASDAERRRWRLEYATLQRLLCADGRAPPAVDASDAERYARLRGALETIGVHGEQLDGLFDVLAAIMQLANVEFVHDEGSQHPARVMNEEPLYVAASLLGAGAASLAHALTNRTRLVRGEVCTMVLDSAGAAANRDALSRMLYALLFAWLTEHVNQSFSRDDFATYIGLLDTPGWANNSTNSLEAFCVNLTAELVQRHCTHALCERRIEELQHEGLSHLAPAPAAEDNRDCVRLLTHYPGGLIHIMDDQTRRRPRKTELTMVHAFSKRWVNHRCLRVNTGYYERPSFVVRHFHGDVMYDATRWLERNDESLAVEHVSLLRGERGGTFGSSSAFVRSLFQTDAVRAQLGDTAQSALGAQPPLRPARAPSTKRVARGATLRASTSRRRRGGRPEQPGAEDEEVYGENAPAQATHGQPCVVGEMRAALQGLFDVLDDAKPWFVMCLRPNNTQLPNHAEPRTLRRQVHALGLPALAAPAHEYPVTLTYPEFCERYGALPGLEPLGMRGVGAAEAKMKVSDACALMNWTDKYIAMGLYKVFLSHIVFRELEDELRAQDAEEEQYNLRKAAVDEEEALQGTVDPYAPAPAPAPAAGPPLPDAFAHEGYAAPMSPTLTRTRSAAQRASFTPAGEYDPAETQSLLSGVMGGGAADPEKQEPESQEEALLLDSAGDADENASTARGRKVAEELPVSLLRRYWVALTWALTFWLPSPLLLISRRLRRSDVRMAWREKLAINMLIWFICACSIFVIVFLGNVVCPKEHLVSHDELQGYKGENAYTAIRGEVFHLGKLADAHQAALPVVPRKLVMRYEGQDASSLFPVQVNALCNGVHGSVSPWVTIGDGNNTDPMAKYHDFRAYRMNDVRPDWYYEQMWYMRNRFRVAFLGYTPKAMKNMLQDGRTLAVYNDEVYDISDYVSQGNQGGVRVPEGMAPPPDIDTAFLAPAVVDLISENPGADITSRFDQLQLPPEVLDRQRVCLRNLFLAGKVDHRTSARCTFSKYILLALSLIMVATIGFKFVAALQFLRPRSAEEHDKFIICQVPCYTEGTDSIRKTINSLAKMRYDDKRKLLFIICDGNITGAGNDAPTPQLVLDLLGAEVEQEPPPRSFVSIGEGARQHNMARVYSGLYEHAGHMVPYVVVAKCGKPTEQVRPGNRGKRDSQLVLMRFLNKVHFGLPMSPLELELYHHIKNIIGVNPSFYEYVMQVDADTVVDSRALARFVAAFVQDKKVIGLCGETAIGNARTSATTMLQVYEYYISHYLIKAFESLFGTITCLPGCFSMYRIRTPDSHRPLFVSNAVLDDYAENRVDTLHTKNLLHLGEDRYLTTLVLKHFPSYKTTFVRDAKCTTAAPDSWRVLLSQRRRWINSTVHNLVELLRTPQLCGFCIFSMRFVVMIDLLSTIIAPVTIGYIVYLIILVAFEGGTIPFTSVVLLAAIYGFQAIIFLLNRRFDMIGWMILYIIGLPLWSLILPLYSFWHMDDFSWGTTRVVTGERGQRLLVHHEGTFDPAEIPHMTWDEYENQLWEHRDESAVPARLRASKHASDASLLRAPSLYGRATHPVAPYAEDPESASVAWGTAPWGAPPGTGAPPMAPVDPGRPVSFAGSHPGSAGTNPFWRSDSATDVYRASLADPFGAGAMLFGGTPRHRGSSATQADEETHSLLGAEPRPASHPGTLPPDEVIRHDIRALVRESDLTTLTKRSLRARLSEMYGCSIDQKKAFINAQIEQALRDL